MTLGMLSTMTTGIFADEFSNTTEDTSNNLACALQDYKNLVEKLDDAENNVEDIEDLLDGQDEDSQEFEDIKKAFEDAKKECEEIKKQLDQAKENLEKEKENHKHGCQLGDSDCKPSDGTIGDSNCDDICPPPFDEGFGKDWDDICPPPFDKDEDGNLPTIGDSDCDMPTIGDSNSSKPHKHHSFKDFTQGNWGGFVSPDFIFTNNKKFKDKQNDALKAEVLALMDNYQEAESYIADMTEDWWLKNKYQLTVKFNNDDEDDSYSIKFNPIMEDGVLTSCYMYVLSEDDTISDGYFITAEEYSNLKTYLNDAFLGDNVVARVNKITDFDDFMELIENSYKKPTDYFFDVDGNTSINSVDLLKIKRHLLHLEVENDEINNYDCNTDARINSADILHIRKKLLHLIQE